MVGPTTTPDEENRNTVRKASFLHVPACKTSICSRIMARAAPTTRVPTRCTRLILSAMTLPVYNSISIRALSVRDEGQIREVTLMHLFVLCGQTIAFYTQYSRGGTGLIVTFLCGADTAVASSVPAIVSASLAISREVWSFKSIVLNTVDARSPPTTTESSTKPCAF